MGTPALQPFASQAGRDSTQKHTDATINVQGGGSGSGLTQVSSGAADIGDSDIFANEKITDDATLKSLVDHKVCGIGFAVVASKDVTVSSLTKEQIQGIFSGKYTSWKDVGGADEKINVINRTKSSGTRATFKNTILGKDVDEKDGLGTTQDASGSVRTAMISTKGAISYLALSYLDSDVRKDINVLKIDGVEASDDNICSGKYPFWSYEHMYTKGEAKGLAKTFLEYMTSKDNEDNVNKLGYIPMNKLKK